jgi:hypothetical protein
MAIAKYYEDIVEARRENGAAIVFEYEYPQKNEYQYPQEHDRQYKQESAEPVTSGEPSKLTVRDRVALRIFVMKLQATRITSRANCYQKPPTGRSLIL